MKPPAPLEHAEQVAFVQWFELQFPGTLIYAIPNGGGRSKAEAGRLKAEGVKAGMPDLHIPRFNLWIEMKRAKGGTVSPAQKAMHEHLRSLGYIVKVCKGFDEARQAVWLAIGPYDRSVTDET